MANLRVEDAEEAAALHAACLAEAYSAESFRELLSDERVKGWKLGPGPMKGLLLWRQIDDEAELLSLAILKSHRRQGIAGWWLERLFQRFRRDGVGRCFLEVRAGNGAAIALYEKLGFRVVAAREGYYRMQDDVEDALVMEWRENESTMV